MKKRSFDESFDNIMIVDYDKEYIDSELISADDYVYSDTQNRISLNEEWNFNVDVFDSAIRGRFFEEIITDSTGLPIPYDFSFDEWDEIPLPNQWNTIRPEYYLFEGTGLYTGSFRHQKTERKELLLE
jgi:beta-glucuronidase